MRMREPDIASMVERMIYTSEGGTFGDSELVENRRKAVNYYLGRPRGDEDPDRSQLQSLDVSDQVEHMLSQMMMGFTTDSPCEFEPDAPNDDSQAELESEAVSKLIMEDSNGYETLYQACKDALLLKNGIIKVYVNTETNREAVTYDNLSAEEEALLAQSAPDDATIETDDDSVTVLLERERRELLIESVDPTNFGVTENWHKQDLQDCPCVWERKFYRRSELLGMGFPKGKVMDLPPYDLDTKPDSFARNIGQTTGTEDTISPSGDLIECYEAYVMLPRNLNDGNGEAERWRVFMSNRTILEKDRVEIVPYVAGTAFIVPHRFWGLSLYDKLKQIQDAKTAALRYYTDWLARGGIQPLHLKGDFNPEDIGNLGAPGHHLRGGLTSEANPLGLADTGSQALDYLNYMDRIRAQRGGASIDLGSPESQLVNSQIGATGVAMVMGAQEMMAGFMARTLSETLIKRLFLLVHRTAREVWRRPMRMKKADQWITTNPAQWRPRTRMNIKTGLTAGERARKTQALSQVLQTQLGLAQATQGSMVGDQQIYRAFMNWAKSAELDNPEQYAIHYESEQAQQAKQAAGQQGQQMSQIQIELAKLPEQVRLEIARMDDKTKREIEVLKAEVEQMKVVGQATKDLELEQLRLRNQSGNGEDSGSDLPVG